MRCASGVQARMHSYMEPVSLAVPMYSGEEKVVLGARRPSRLMLVGGALAVLACSALVLSAFTTAPGDESELSQKAVPKITPKFVDWKKEDAGSDDMNLHLKVADALARADGLAEKNLSPVPEKLLKEAQQAAEEQRSMPGLGDELAKKPAKPKIPASLEKMFQQAEAEQKVEKIAKEGDEKRDEEVKSKKAAVKAAAAKKMATSKAEKSASMKLLKQVSQDASATSHKKLASAPKKASKK